MTGVAGATVRAGSVMVSAIPCWHFCMDQAPWCCSVAKLHLTFCNPRTAARQGSLSFTISWSLLRLLFHWVGDAIQPSHPLSPLSPPALSLSQHQGLFSWVSSSYQVANILELQHKHQFFQWIVRFDFLWAWLVRSACCPKDSPYWKMITATIAALQGS